MLKHKPKYLAAEDEWISTFAQTDHVDFLYEKFSLEGTKNSWPQRTRSSFIRRFRTIGESIRPELDGWSCIALAQAIPMSKHLVRIWVSKGLLQSKKIGQNYRITSLDFKKFADKYPKLLRSVDPNNLHRLLPERIVEKILACPVQTQGVRFKVKRSDTGEVFENIRSMAAHSSFSRAKIISSIDTGKPIDGVLFTRVGFKRKDYSLQSKIESIKKKGNHV